MLKRLLASIAIVSLLLGVVVLVYWWRANSGHSDQFTLGTTASTQSHFTTMKDMAGRCIVIIEVHEKVAGGIREEWHPYPFKQFIGWFMLLPGFWLAIKLRSLLPRPGRGG